MRRIAVLMNWQRTMRKGETASVRFCKRCNNRGGPTAKMRGLTLVGVWAIPTSIADTPWNWSRSRRTLS